MSYESRRRQAAFGILGPLALAAIPSFVGPAAHAAEANPDAERCEALRGLRLGDATVRSSSWFGGGEYRAAGGRASAMTDLPAFCRAILSASPVPASNIVIETWLPPAEAWNGKLLASGNGGFGGSIRTDSLAAAVKRGYAGANTDMGTFPASILPNTGYDAGIGHPEMIKDWGYRSTHEMTLAAKAVIETYYQRRQSRSYFIGCSTGGHQALSEAQRYPEDYDGIIAGAAGHNRTHLHASFQQRFQQMQTSAPLFSPGKADLVNKSLLAACAVKDGGAPGDPYLSNPAACDFQPRQLLCATGQSGDSCLTEKEVAAIESMYDGTRNPRTHELIYPGWAKGTESSVTASLQRVQAATKTGNADGIFRWVFGPQWDARTFDFDREMSKTDGQIGSIVNSLNTNLNSFSKRGGKLILFHGWADSVVSPYDSIIYFDGINGIERAQGADILLKTPSPFSRLFMAPGMSHCSGGPGADSFGQNAAPDGQPDPKRDIVAALDTWVETGTAPELLIASKSGQDGKMTFERPLCPYPTTARYDRTGDPRSASSYICSEAQIGKFEFPAKNYLR